MINMIKLVEPQPEVELDIATFFWIGSVAICTEPKGATQSFLWALPVPVRIPIFRSARPQSRLSISVFESASEDTYINYNLIINMIYVCIYIIKYTPYKPPSTIV